MSFMSEFKAFAMRGNVMDLAVAVVIGAAFSKIVAALVDGIIMPVLGLLMGGINVSGKTFLIGQTVVKWGLFLQSVIDFTIISFSIFCFISLINKIQKKEDALPVKDSDEVVILKEIRDLLKNPHLKS